MNHPEKSHTNEDSAKEIGQGAMKPEEADHGMLRQCLLGELSDEKQTALEVRLMTEDLLFEQLKSLEDELIDDYLDGTLTDAERERFERRAAQHPDMQKRIEFTRALKRSVNRRRNIQALNPMPKPIRPLQRVGSYRAYFKIAAIVLITIGVAFVLWRVVSSPSPTDEGLADLRKLYQGNRPLEARLAGFNYAPFTATRGDNSRDDVRARDRIALKLLDAVEREPGAKSLHALGNYYSTEKQFDKALPQFEAALKLDPNNAQLHNDYGAALLEKAKAIPPNDSTGKRLESLGRALEHFSRAVELNGSFHEALFNRALCLQLFNLPDQSKKAWREYLDRDSSSPWADEARQNLQELEEQKSSAKTPDEILADFFVAYGQSNDERAWKIVSQTKEMITGAMIFFQLTQGFLEADAKKENEKADKYLAMLHYVGNLEKEKAGDPYFAEMAGFYKSSSQQTRLLLTEAQNKLKQGYLLTKNSNYKEAVIHFSNAKELFDRAEDSWESKVTDYWLIYSNSRLVQYEAITKELLLLETFCKEKSYKWLRSQALVWISNRYLVQNEYSKAIEYHKVALIIAREIGDTYNQQKLLTGLATFYARLDNFPEALAFIEQSLILNGIYFVSMRQTWRNYTFAAEVLYRFKLQNTAIFFGHEALETALSEVRDPSSEHVSRLYLASLYGEKREFPIAMNFAQQSLELAQTLNGGIKQLSINHSDLKIAHLHRQSGNCEAALKKYETVIEANSRRDLAEYKVNIYDAHKGRLLCFLALNQDTFVERELPLVLELFENYRAQILEEQSRNTFFDAEQSVYDLAIDFVYTRGNPRLAFQYLENSKARSLLDSLTDKSLVEKSRNATEAPEIKFKDVVRPVPLDELQRHLPEDVQLIQYALLQDKILIWVIGRDQFSIAENKISSDEVSQRLALYLRLITENESEKSEKIREESHWFYEALINPVLPMLQANKEICFVADKKLYRLPLVSLVSPETGRYLVEDFTIFSAPSANSFLLATESARQKSSLQNEKLLSVGNPVFDRRAHPNLPDLPAAEKEANEIASFYPPHPRILIGSQADKETILDGITTSNVFHFAGHYLVNERFALRSKLITKTKFTPLNAADDGSIEVHEIAERKLSAVKLAVLSACRTGVETEYSGEGMIGAARTFLASGVPLVIASQWSVDSDATASLMLKFHRYRKQSGVSSATALRRAQMEMLRDSNNRYSSPYYWAGFLPIGGYTLY